MPKIAEHNAVPVDILCLGEAPDELRASLSSRGFRLVRPDDAARLDQGSASIRGIVRYSGAIDAALMERHPSLEVIASFGVGYDMIDVAAAAGRGIAVGNTSGVLDDEVADFAVGLLLATLREIPQANRHVLSGGWAERQYRLSASLRERTVGLVGMGRIGQKIARRIAAFDVPVVYHSRSPKPGLEWAYFPDLTAMAEAVDTLVVIVPGGPGTYRLVDRGILAALGGDGILVNVARGSVVDEAALRTALEDGTILAAGLDVFDNEPRPDPGLCDLPNVVATPHIGSGSHVTRRRMWDLVGENIIAWFEESRLVSPVPEAPGPARP